MSTTSLKLHDDLKQRAAAVAQLHGITPHAFMIQAIELVTQAAECRSSFLNDAVTSRQRTLELGKGYDADEVHAYLRARVSGEKAAKPRAKSW